MSLKHVGLLFFVRLVLAQKPSPCPEIFSYEPRGQELDRWYGVVSLQTKEDLDEVWLKIILDQPAELLGNWFGEAVSSDNQVFTIRNQRYKLEAGPPVSVRFFIKYNAASIVPSVKSIKLNGRTICTTKIEEIVTTTPKLHISQGGRETRPTNRPAGIPSSSNSDSGIYINQPERTERPSSSNGNSFGGSSRERPNSGGSSVGLSNNGRPSNTNGIGGSSQERPGNNRYDNQPSNSQAHSSSNRRPSSSSSHQTTSSSKHRDRETQTMSSGTQHSNVLSAEDDSPTDFDHFPGDFAFPSSPTARPASRPSSISKRNVQCGTVAMKATPLISYGQNTTQGQWPWHAALYYAQGAQLMYTCGATLISESHILTAAHCVTKPQTNRPIDTKKLAVYLGKYSLKKFGSGIQDRDVSRIYVHPQYNYSVYFNDIAVLKLKNPIDVTNYVRPCCLWEDATDIEAVINQLGTVVGWGFDENRQISDSLMQAQMPVVSTVNCIYSNREFFSQFTFEKNYCAGFRNGTTVCNGDSGGGMVFPKRGTSGANTVWQIRGIVSVSVALQGQGVCDPSHYIVFTDVAKHLDWIKQVMNQQ